jgi:hypothetical protein
MRKAAPFSMRLSDVTDQLVSEEARRTRRTKGAVVEGLAEEALRARRFPGSRSAAATGTAVPG